MDTRNIKTVLNSRGVDVQFGQTISGTIARIPVGNNQFICSLLPIDDDSDMRFCDFLESQARKFREGTYIPDTTQKEIEG